MVMYQMIAKVKMSNGFNGKGGDVFLTDIRVVGDIGNQHENVYLGFRIKE